MEKSFMKTPSRYLVPICLLFAMLGQAQNSDLFKLWPDSVLAKANTARSVSYLSEEEKEVIYYMNLCRMNPELFGKTYLKNYLSENKIKKDKYVKGLLSYLEGKEDMPVLKPSKDLTEAAEAHAKDMGNTGRTGHNSSNGTSFADRMNVFSEVYSGINENCNYGMEDGRDIVMDLLIDREVSNAGHRKNILDSEMRFVGVAIEPHKRFRFNCVQDFGGKKL